MSDLGWMREALREAGVALEKGEVPIGAVVVRDGVVLARAHNLREECRDPFGHAEVLALRRAARRLGDWRLEGSTLYVTLEPCPMCTGAMLQARLARLVFGTPNLRVGCAGTRLNLADYPGMDHRIQVTGGVLEEEARSLLERFFSARRERPDAGAGRPRKSPGEVAEPG